jgi:uncharacterized surface protein with fasciclin (FAS1) repeats
MSRFTARSTTTRLSGLAALALSATTVIAATTGPAAAAAPATADKAGEKSLVAVLDADGNKFDRKWDDFDIVHRAATTVLGANPDSAVGVLADGSTALTAFIPSDRAFRRLVFQLTGDRLRSERAVFDATATLGVDTIEDVLLYHVVPGATITADQAKKSDGAKLTTALSDLQLQVALRDGKLWLRDLDDDDRNPRVLVTDINKGNKQIAHGISRVLRPSDLP